jgi:chromosomal replication initiation ATPase DnaA
MKVVKPRQMLYYLCKVKSNMGIKEIKGYLSKLKIEVNDVVITYGITTFTKLD